MSFLSFQLLAPKVEEHLKIFRYVPYSALTLASRIKAAAERKENDIQCPRGAAVKSLDRRNEKSISAVDWHTARVLQEERIRFHHGDARASAFIAHHKPSHGSCANRTAGKLPWRYDIQQREVAALNPSHDLTA